MAFIILTSKQGENIIKYKLTKEYPKFEGEDPKKIKDLKKRFHDQAKLFVYSHYEKQLFFINEYKIKLKNFYSNKPNDKWEFVHVSHLSSHFGRDRLHNKISQIAYGITREVCTAVVKACIYCRQRNNHITKPGYTPIIPKYPRE